MEAEEAVTSCHLKSEEAVTSRLRSEETVISVWRPEEAVTSSCPPPWKMFEMKERGADESENMIKQGGIFEGTRTSAWKKWRLARETEKWLEQSATSNRICEGLSVQGQLTPQHYDH